MTVLDHRQGRHRIDRRAGSAGGGRAVRRVLRPTGRLRPRILTM